MSLRNCPECGRLFVLAVRDLCPDCISKEERDYDSIKGYLKRNPGAGIVEVSEKTGVSEKRILFFLRAGKLILDPSNTMPLTCEHCGRPIASGRYCDDCCNSIGKRLEENPASESGSNVRKGDKDRLGRFTKFFQK